MKKKVDNIFSSTVRDIQNLVLPHLESRQRKRIIDNKMIAMGGKLDKSLKRPYNLLQQDRKYDKERIKNEMEELKQKGYTSLTGRYTALQAQKKKKEMRTARYNKATVEDTLRLGREGGTRVTKTGVVVVNRKSLHGSQHKPTHKHTKGGKKHTHKGKIKGGKK
eukprot:GHVR01136951.1.p1 GENE.GHVR01136951.1~~GHVR01136951.1.p1  ORF type:complete len:164 (-),score=39.25 GHVR01136951.1:187-678(-)